MSIRARRSGVMKCPAKAEVTVAGFDVVDDLVEDRVAELGIEVQTIGKVEDELDALADGIARRVVIRD
ncbi:MAG: hypothetical protein WD274_02585, partial [Acidimicrobiia bacterium]